MRNSTIFFFIILLFFFVNNNTILKSRKYTHKWSLLNGEPRISFFHKVRVEFRVCFVMNSRTPWSLNWSKKYYLDSSRSQLMSDTFPKHFVSHLYCIYFISYVPYYFNSLISFFWGSYINSFCFYLTFKNVSCFFVFNSFLDDKSIVCVCVFVSVCL